MSGALNSVFGGGGLIGAAMSVVSVAFPPAGIAASLGNMLSQGIGQAVSGAAQQLCKEAGMPKFLQGIIDKVIQQVLGGCKQPTDPACDKACQQDGGVKKTIDDFVQNMMKELVDKVKEEMGTDAKRGGTGKKSGGSWLEALSKALGAVAGEKAAKMVDLSNQISGLAGDSSKEAAAKMTELNSELSGTGKMFSLLQETISTTVKSIGDGLNSVARKG